MIDLNHYSISDIVRRCNVTHQTVYRWLKAGTIPAEAVSKVPSRGRYGFKVLVKSDVAEALPVRANKPAKTVATEAATA